MRGWVGCCVTSTASLALAQRCSAVAAAPLFTTAVNYRYQRVRAGGSGERKQVF